MATVEFFKKQAKNLLQDYNTRVYNEIEGYYEYNPRFFYDIDEIVFNFDIDKNAPFTLMKAQHIIARLSGFTKWTELIKASESILEIGKLLLTNRESYQEEQGYITNAESLIVEDWQLYEKEYLIDCDDETKLKAFNDEFLLGNWEPDELSMDDEIIPDVSKILSEIQQLISKNKSEPIVLSFSRNIKAQDMIKTIMDCKDLPPDEAILSSINFSNYFRIVSTGWADIAVDLWRHDNPNHKFERLSNPTIEIRANNEQSALIQIVTQQKKVSPAKAVLYFMIFELEELGHHI